MITERKEKILDPVLQMLSALKWIDIRLESPERRIAYPKDIGSDKASFLQNNKHSFDVGDSLRTDIAMALFFGQKLMENKNRKLGADLIAYLAHAGFIVSSIVCVGDEVTSWIVAGKHFVLEMYSS